MMKIFFYNYDFHWNQHGQNTSYFIFQVGVVLLSILCHIWKIVPDLYEAIDTLLTQQQTLGNEGGVTPLPSLNSTEELQHVGDLSKANISEEMNYHLSVNNSLFYTTYGPSFPSLSSSSSSPYFEELTRNGTLETILMIPDGVYPSISNCSDLLKRLSEHYNLTSEALINVFTGTEDVNEDNIEVGSIKQFQNLILIY